MAGLGGFAQGFAQGLMGGAQMNLQRQSLERQQKNDELLQGMMREQMELTKKYHELRSSAAVIDQGTKLLATINGLQQMPDSIRSTVAPHILKGFIDPNTDEGKAFVKAATSIDEEGIAYFQGLVASIVKNPEARAALSQPNMLRAFGLNPIKTLTELQELAKASKDTPTFHSPEGKQVADREALVARFGANSEQVRNFDRAVNPQTGPFRGTGMDAQVINFLLDPQADPSSAQYRAAYNYLAQPKLDLESGRMIKPDMSAYRKPGETRTVTDQGTTLPPPGATQTATAPTGPTVEQIPGFDSKKLQDSRAAAATILSSLKDFEGAAKKAGVGERLISLMGGNTGLNTAYNVAALLSKSEELFNLGVLNGPDLDIIRRTLPDPSTFRGQMDLGKSATAAVAKVERLILTRLNAKEREGKAEASTTQSLLKGLPRAPADDEEPAIPPPPKGFKVID